MPIASKNNYGEKNSKKEIQNHPQTLANHWPKP